MLRPRRAGPVQKQAKINYAGKVSRKQIISALVHRDRVRDRKRASERANERERDILERENPKMEKKEERAGKANYLGMEASNSEVVILHGNQC